jgi:hypothetical protein
LKKLPASMSCWPTTPNGNTQGDTRRLGSMLFEQADYGDHKSEPAEDTGP